MDRQTDGQTDGQTDRRTDRQGFGILIWKHVGTQKISTQNSKLVVSLPGGRGCIKMVQTIAKKKTEDVQSIAPSHLPHTPVCPDVRPGPDGGAPDTRPGSPQGPHTAGGAIIEGGGEVCFTHAPCTVKKINNNKW